MSAKTITVAQLAEELGVSTATVRRMVAKGEVPHLRIGDRIIFGRQRIDTWFEEQLDASIAASATPRP